MVLPCQICSSKANDVEILGEFGMVAKHKLHRNCLVISMGKLVYNKTGEYPLRKFLSKDLPMLKRRYDMRKCVYCTGLGANITCSEPGCVSHFHTKCGMDNMAVFQYGEKFRTFCAEHAPEHRSCPQAEDMCVLCLEQVVPDGKDFSPAMGFQAPCCHNGWFHRVCVQNLATASTDDFKCPLCRNERVFAQVAFFGVVIPKWRVFLPKPRPVPNEAVIHISAIIITNGVARYPHLPSIQF